MTRIVLYVLIFLAPWIFAWLAVTLMTLWAPDRECAAGEEREPVLGRQRVAARVRVAVP